MTFSKISLLFATILTIAGWTTPVRAERIVIDPYAKKVAEQKEDNKRWEKDAEAEEKRLMQIADTYYKEKDYLNARKYYLKVLDIRYKQWNFPAEDDGHERPAKNTDTLRLSSSSRRRAESRLEDMVDTINEQRLKELAEQAEVLEIMEEHAQAYRAYEALVAEAEKMGVKRYAATQIKRAKSAQEKILKPANDLLDDVNKLVKKEDAEGATEKLKEVGDSYGYLLKLSPELAERYKSLGGISIIANEAREEEAASRLRLADSAKARKDYSTAYQYYTTLSTTYADTEAGMKAKLQLADMMTNSEVRDTILSQQTETQCRILLARANAFYGQDRWDEARAACEEVVLIYPDTTWAADAVELLDLIKKKEASPEAE